MIRTVLLLFAVFGILQAADPAAPPVEGDFLEKDFKFSTGETLSINIHYTTLGKPVKNAQGQTTNAVWIGHGTGGTGRSFLSPAFGGNLFGAGQLLDTSKYFVILADGLGHGKSSKPSDGLKQKFPKYTYDDMVRAQYRLVTEGLGVNHLRLVLGTSMGAMHAWMWGYMYPDFMDALMPLASAPVEIAGRNRMMREMIIQALRTDPDFNDGNYTKPLHGMIAAEYSLFMMGSSPLQLLKQAPTRAEADKLFQTRVVNVKAPDPNDMIYYFDASREYNPAPHLEKIKAPLLAINSADDQVNPPELGILEREIKRVKNGRYILLPITDETRGHGTHSLPAIWGRYLAEFLAQTAK